jgi:hypothetical protein
MRISGVTYASRKTHKLRNFFIILFILIIAAAAVMLLVPDLRTAVFDFFNNIVKTFPFLKE